MPAAIRGAADRRCQQEPKIVSASEAKNKLGSIIGWVLRND
jgi:hypothetical protein